MMSLYLKALEGEKSQLPPKQHLLPELKYNVVCGNSLIGPDVFEQGTLFGDKEIDRINAFDWQDAFAEIMKEGGFDAVIGNPPWLMAGYYVPETVDYLHRKFSCAVGKFDLYYVFIEQGCRLLSRNGYFGMIVPNKFFYTRAAANLRKMVSEDRWLRAIVDFGDEHLFQGATNYSCILLLRKYPGRGPTYVKAKAGLTVTDEFRLAWPSLSASPWHFSKHGIGQIFNRLERLGTPLEKITQRFGTGVQSGADRLLMLDLASVGEEGLEKSLLRPVLRGRDVRRYSAASAPKFLIFPYTSEDGEFKIMPEAQLRRYPRIYQRLLADKSKLSKRIWFSKNAEQLSGKWYGMMYLDSYESFAAPHILTPSLSDRSNFAMGTGDLFATGTAGVTSIVPNKDIEDIEESISYLLGVLNSSLMSSYAVSHSPIFSGGYYKFSAPYLKQLPIRRIDFSNPTEKSWHDRLVILVVHMQELNKKKRSAGSRRWSWTAWNAISPAPMPRLTIWSSSFMASPTKSGGSSGRRPQEEFRPAVERQQYAFRQPPRQPQFCCPRGTQISLCCLPRSSVW